jgi:ELWxxDGT repeat protein
MAEGLVIALAAVAVAAQPVMLTSWPPGVGDADPEGLTIVGDRLFFSAQDLEHGRELWVSDGTGTGSRLVKDIRPGAEGSSLTSSTRIVPFGGRILFTANDGEHGAELWVSDGTESGTRLVKDICPGPESSDARWIATIGARAFFAAYQPERGYGALQGIRAGSGRRAALVHHPRG